MTYPHTPQGTGKRRGVIEEGRTRFYFYENTSKIFPSFETLFFSGPVEALYAPFWGSHPYVRHTNVLTCCPSRDSALWERGESQVFKVQVHESRGVVKVDGPAWARPRVTWTCEQYIIYLLLCAETESVVKSKVASVFTKLKIPRIPRTLCPTS